jgi:hypothetical protein
MDSMIPDRDSQSSLLDETEVDSTESTQLTLVEEDLDHDDEQDSEMADSMDFGDK